MNWFSEAVSSSIGRKIVMAVTGLFLCSFLIIHASGNFSLFSDDGGLGFNAYTKFMTTNPIIRVMEIVLLLGFVFHIWQGFALSYKNRKARPVRYAVWKPEENTTSWASRNMGLLGTIIFIFLLVHLWNFYFKLKFGEIPYDAAGNKNLFLVVKESFENPIYSIFYVISMVFLAFHLHHGFQSAFHTMGWNHKKYTPFIKFAGTAFAIIISAAFAAMPLYFLVFNNG